MDNYTKGYKQKSWLNKKGGKDRSLQWSYNNKNNFTTPNNKGIKKKKAKNKSKFKDISKRNSELSDMYFKEHSQSSLPNSSSVDKRTIVDIVDSDMEICYRETNYNEKINKRKKSKDNSGPVIPEYNHMKDSDLFYFDIYGNQSTLPSPAKHIHFGDNNKPLNKTSTSPNSSVVSVQSNVIQKSKKARNIINQPNSENSLSPTLVRPKKRKKFSITSDGGSMSQKEFNLEDAGNSLITEIKESPKAKKSKHFMEYEPSNSAKSYSESFVGSEHEKSVNESLKNIESNKNDSASNLDDDKIYEFIQNMIMKDLSNNPKSLLKTTTDTPKLSTNALIDVLSETNPNNTSTINNIDDSTNFNMRELSDNSRTELSVKNKKKKKFSEERGYMKTVCTSELESSDSRSVNNIIDSDNSVTVRKKKKSLADHVVLNKEIKSSNSPVIDNTSFISEKNHSDLNSRTELSVKNKKKKKFSEERGGIKTVCTSELESSNSMSVINSIDSDNSVTVRKKKKRLADHVEVNKEKKSSNGYIIDNTSFISENNHSDLNSRTELSVKNKKKKKFFEERGDIETICTSELENRDGRSVINGIDSDNNVTVKKKKKRLADHVVLNKETKSSNSPIIDNSSIISEHNHSDLNSKTDLSVKNKKKKKFSEEHGDIKTVCTSELESSNSMSVINSIDYDNSVTVRKKKKRLADHVEVNKEKKSSNSSIIDNSSIISDENIDTNEEKTIKNFKKSPKYNGESDTPEITECSVTCELLKKDEGFEETYNKLDVDASKVCKQYNEFESMYDRLSPASVNYKLNIEDVYTDDQSDESTIVETKWDKKLANLKQNLDEDERQTLTELEIVLPFKTIPPLHDIQRPSKPTPKEMQLAKELNAKLGPFSKHEDEQIVTNWENFCKDHNLSVKPSVFFKFHRSLKISTKIQFLQYLSHKLDNRHPLNVHSRFQRLFSNNDIKTGRFTKKEDAQIVKFINKSNSKTPYRDLGILLGRSAESINRRVSLLSETRHGDKIGWGLELSKRLIEGMFTVTGLKRVKDLEHVTINAEQWRKLSILLDNISEKKLHRAWFCNVHPKLFLKETNTTIKRDLIKMMLLNKERDFRTVNWKKYADNFNGINERKLYELFVNMIRQKVPKEKWSNLRRVVKFLSKDTCRSRKIHRYIYKDGKLEIE